MQARILGAAKAHAQKPTAWTRDMICTFDGVLPTFGAHHALRRRGLGTPDEVPRRGRAHRLLSGPAHHGPSVCEYLHCITLLQFPPLFGPLHHPAAPSQRSRLRRASSPVPSASPTFLPFSPLLHFYSRYHTHSTQTLNRTALSSRPRIFFDSRIAGQMIRRRLGRRLCAPPGYPTRLTSRPTGTLD